MIKTLDTKSEVKSVVIKAAKELFFQKGIREVTMDDVAKSLRMSKRTLYQLFNDKEDLLIACHRSDSEYRHKKMEAMMLETDNVLEIILKNFEITLSLMQNISIKFFQELPRYTRLYEHICHEREKHYEKAVRFLQKGVEQGYLRDDIKYDIVYQMCVQMCDILPQREELTKYSPWDFMRSTFVVYLRGCTTTIGLSIIDKFLENYKLEESDK